jgi:hypothetical protein
VGRSDRGGSISPNCDQVANVILQLVQGQPVWARIFYLVRTGHVQEALGEALHYQQAIEHREASFVSHFRTWIESLDRRYVGSY